MGGERRAAHHRVGFTHELIQPMTLIDALGYTAATLTTASFMPQAWLTFRTRDVSGISLAMYSVFTLGIALWLAYGIFLRAWPIVVANTVTFVLAAAILGMKLTLGGRHD
jgi:MtN3 and saliva related transmembrane protein